MTTLIAQGLTHLGQTLKLRACAVRLHHLPCVRKEEQHQHEQH